MSSALKVLLRISLLILLITGVAAPLSPAHAATPSPVTILQRAQKASQTVSYTAQQTIWRRGTSAILSQIWDNGRKSRIEYIAPSINRGDIQIDDGTNVYRYHRSENGVVQTPSPRRTPINPAIFNKNYSAKLLGSATVAGRRTWIVGVSRRGSRHFLRKFWIDQRNYLRLRAEYFDPNGQRTETIQLSNIQFTSVPASRFAWKMPAGAKINNAGELYSHLSHALHQVSWLRVPSWLPAGYVFESAVINKANNEAWLRYSNGSRRFSVFEQRTKDKNNSKPQKVTGGWFWKEGAIRFLVAGLGDDDAKKLAESF